MRSEGETKEILNNAKDAVLLIIMRLFLCMGRLYIMLNCKP